MSAVRKFSIDPSRVAYRKPDDDSHPYDRECPDAVWVPVIGADMEDVNSSEAQREVLQYVANKFGLGDGIDRTDGPMPDDGRVMPFMLGTAAAAAAEGSMTADEYLRQAAVTQMTPRHGKTYVAFHRVRRLHAV